MIQCKFCKIIRGESGAEVLFKNKNAIAILDINPIHYGHVLVMPQRHRATLVEVPDEELLDL
ncbi:MAG TPA: HIT domain-containing protein, partial [Bacteroidota bacterium]|nr:HIT domain-containing protein [Bacteroidota bacterium]